MRVPMNWLKEFVDTGGLTATEIAEKLTRAGVEVEGISTLTPPLPGVVVAEVLTYTRHPTSEKLWITRVTTGSEEYQVVAGVQNFEAGDKVPLALPGARLPGGEITRTEIWGVTSNGMLCSFEELGLELALEEDVILILDPKARPGDSIEIALDLDDEILELGLTPNRSDCLGLIGVAIEVGVLTGAGVKLPGALPLLEKPDALQRVSVTIEDPGLCPRYTAMVVDSVRVAPSPLDLQIRLLKAGIRPINNVVDISNYVMWETGQPLHTFDFDKVEGRQIIVRRARPGEEIVTLDQQERTLRPDTLVIADRDAPVALAGIMGGFDSEITGETGTVLVEAACFHPTNNRRTARSLGLTSEASTRFEKGVDPAGTGFAARRTAYLLEKLAGGAAVPGQVDVYPVPVPQRRISLHPQKVRDLMGLDLPAEKMAQIFTSLGFSVEDGEAGRLTVQIPTRRRDIELEVDLVEEVARIYGYEHIETTFPVGIMTQGEKPVEQKNLDKVREVLLGAGLSEAITFSFMKEATFTDLRLPAGHSLRQAIPVKNPLSEENSLLRTTLLGNLLSSVKYNLNRQQEDISIFEVGKVFIPDTLPLTSQPEERMTLSLAATGKRGKIHWQEAPPRVGFYWLKGVLEGVFAALGLRDITWKPARVPYLHPTQGGEIWHGDNLIGLMGAVHPGVLDNFEIEEKVFCAEVDLSHFIGRWEPLNFKGLPRYPAIVRDLALIVPKEIPAARVEKVIQQTGGELVEKVSLFDVYTGQQVVQGHKSLAYTVTYRDYRETLRDERVNQVQGAILESLKSLGITLRS